MDNLEIINPMPNALGQNTPMEECKMHQCKSADCTNAFMQNDWVQYGNLPQPLPENTTKNSTDITTDISTNPSIIPSEQLAQKNNSYEQSILSSKWKDGRMDRQTKKSYKDYLEILRQNTGYYDHLEVGNKFRARETDEILKVLADVFIFDDEEILKVNQMNISASVVKARFLELKESHLEHLIFVLKDHDQEVRNIRAFILTSAFNTPSTIDSYYTNKVNYDQRHW